VGRRFDPDGAYNENFLYRRGFRQVPVVGSSRAAALPNSSGPPPEEILGVAIWSLVELLSLIRFSHEN